MKYILSKLGYISPFMMFGAVLVIASGVKGEPMNLSLAAWGVGGLVFSALTFPRPGHPLFEALVKDRGRHSEKTQTKKLPSRAEENDKWVQAHWEEEQAARRLSDASSDVTDAEATDLQTPDEFELEPDYSGWCRHDPVVGPSDKATSWIGGRPKMPDEVKWPQKNGRHAVLAAQVAVADLPDNIWGGIGPKSGYLLFFMAPYGEGSTVIHTDELGPERDYPTDNWLMNYLHSGPRNALASCGRPLSSFEPPKWEVKIITADKHPQSMYEKARLDGVAQSALETFDLTAQHLSTVGAPPEADHWTVKFLAGEIYCRDPDALSRELRAVLEADWRLEAKYEAASMSGPIPSDYPYSDLENPVLLLQLQASNLIGWGFGDLDRCAFFIRPSDLKSSRWDKAWFDIAN